MMSDTNRTLTRTEVANRAGVSRETVRYYEQRGLIPEPRRSAAGYRQYGVETVQRIQFVKQAQRLGFTLAEIEELLSLRVAPGTSRADLRRVALEKAADIGRRITSLQRMEGTLTRLAQQCGRDSGAGDGSPLSKCPILDALDGDFPDD